MPGQRGRILAALVTAACAAGALVPIASADRHGNDQPVVGKPKLGAHGCASVPE